MTHPCPEGCVSCDKLTLKCVSKVSGGTIVAIGSTWHTVGADGVTPSRFLGYRFIRGGKEYRIYDEMFQVVGVDGKVIIEERLQTADK